MKIIPVNCNGGFGEYLGKVMPVENYDGVLLNSIGIFFGLDVGTKYVVIGNKLEPHVKTLTKSKVIGSLTYDFEVKLDTTGQILDAKLTKTGTPIPNPLKLRTILYECWAEDPEGTGIPTIYEVPIAEFIITSEDGYTFAGESGWVKQWVNFKVAYWKPGPFTGAWHWASFGGYFRYFEGGPIVFCNAFGEVPSLINGITYRKYTNFGGTKWYDERPQDGIWRPFFFKDYPNFGVRIDFLPVYD